MASETSKAGNHRRVTSIHWSKFMAEQSQRAYGGWNPATSWKRRVAPALHTAFSVDMRRLPRRQRLSRNTTGIREVGSGRGFPALSTPKGGEGFWCSDRPIEHGPVGGCRPIRGVFREDVAERAGWGGDQL